MVRNDPSNGQEDPLETALDEFTEAWFSGEAPDVDAFCSRHAECEPELRKKIEGFLFVAGSLPVQDGDRERTLEGDLPFGGVVDDFRLVREIGRGGMGVVYEAEQVSLRRKVALKILPSHLSFSDWTVKKFRREAEAGARQQHPGMVAVYAVGEHEGLHYIAQEMVEGSRTLADLLEERQKEAKPSPGYFNEMAKFMEAMADAMQHAHERGVIHRDLKPSNILITHDGHPKVTDFGLAKVEDALALSRTGDFSGTPYYMSPEQVEGPRDAIDQRSDIFSLGVTLYEILTLKRPFEGKTSMEVMRRVLAFEPRDPRKINPKVPYDLAVICLKCIEKDRRYRYPSMAEFRDDLRRCRSGDTIQARPSSPWLKAWKRMRRHPKASILLALTILILTVTAVVVPWVVAEKDRERRLADERCGELAGLSDGRLLDELHRDEKSIWPAHPEMIPELEAWIELAMPLIQKLPGHQQSLELLRRQAVRAGEREEEPWEFQDPALQWQHDELSHLVTGVQDLKEDAFESVRNRLAFAKMVYGESISKYRKEWDRVIEAVVDEAVCPRYQGLRLKPMVGLVPIGRDPESGLFEFAHLQTGEIPERDTKGRLIFNDHTALVLVLIPGGTFDMGAMEPGQEHPLGSPNVDPMAKDLEGPVHAVTLPSFLISKYEMTFGQWYRFTEENLWSMECEKIFKIHYGDDVSMLRFPVTNVNWHECKDVLFQLGLRLPSESEWEYAARAGTTTVWWTGDAPDSLQGFANLDGTTPAIEETSETMRWKLDNFPVHAPVGSLGPNPFGLHDICGNVWEWCADHWSGTYKRTPQDGSPQNKDPSHLWRIKRGGCWDGGAEFCRSACRDYIDAKFKNWHHGVRPACSLP